MMKKASAFLILALIFIWAAPVIGTEYPGSIFGPFYVGTKLYSGGVAPSDGFGIDGDYYFDTVAGNLYNKTSGSWVLRANLIGPTGPTGPAGAANMTAGPTGPTGAAGTNGTKWWAGDVSPSDGYGDNGDYYIDMILGNIYNKTSGSWVYRMNIIGPMNMTQNMTANMTAGPPGGGPVVFNVETVTSGAVAVWNGTDGSWINGSTVIISLNTLNVGTRNISGVNDPVVGSDAATKNYVDNRTINGTLVSGPNSAAAGNFPSFSSTTGREIQDSGKSADSIVNDALNGASANETLDLRKDGSRAATGSLSMGGYSVRNVGPAVNGSDAANRTLVESLSSINGSVVVGPASATDSIIVVFDGVTGKIIKAAIFTVESLIKEIETQFAANDTVTLNSASIMITNNLSVNNTLETKLNASQYFETKLNASQQYVRGPSSVTDEVISVFDGTTGRLVKAATYTVTALIDYLVNRASIMDAANISAVTKELETQFAVNDSITLNSASIMVSNNMSVNNTLETKLNASQQFVRGPGSVTDEMIAVFDGTTGRLIKAATYTVDSLINKIFIDVARNDTATMTGATNNETVFRKMMSNISLSAYDFSCEATTGCAENVSNRGGGSVFLELFTLDFTFNSSSVDGRNATSKPFQLPGYFSGTTLTATIFGITSTEEGHVANMSTEAVCWPSSTTVKTKFGVNTSTTMPVAAGGIITAKTTGPMTPGGASIGPGYWCVIRLRMVRGDIPTPGFQFLGMNVSHDVVT